MVFNNFNKDLEWKIIYVGSAESEQHDQELDDIMVGPVPVGVNKFVFQANAPDYSKLPPNDVLGVTVVLLTCSYMGREFVRVGYYVNNEYLDESLREEPPLLPDFDKLSRNILADKPRVTRFPIAWTREIPPPELPEVEGDPDAEPAEMEIVANEEVISEGMVV
jgi:histone chaperone ASF1